MNTIKLFLMNMLLLAILSTAVAQNILPKVSSGKLICIENFQSKYVTQRNIDVWLPDGYTSSQKYDVVYMHDGQMLFDSTQTWNKQSWKAAETISELIKCNKIKPCIVVAIWNVPEKRFADYFPEKVIPEIAEPYKTQILTQQIKGNASADNYLKFLVTELKPFIDEKYSTYKEAKNTFIIGSSMGGLVSAYAICEYPNVFGGAACLSIHSPLIMYELINENTDKEVASKFRDYLQQKLPKANTKKIYFDYGSQTGDAFYKPYQDKLDTVMIKKGYDKIHWQTQYFEGESHSENSWAKRLYIPLTFLLSNEFIKNTIQTEKFNSLPFGSIKPTGWLKEQMQKDVDGFVGNLDKIVPELINDPIYGKGRLQKHSKAKDLGNHKEGDAEGDEQYKWWNSETQSNWWDGYLRNVFLLDDKNGIEKVKNYVDAILATQDEDGYLGIYDQELRYKFNSENGELWSKATLYRGLLAYYESTKDEKVYKSVERAVENVMKNYPINTSSPFSTGTSFNGGVSHGLTFTDILERMYYYTKNEKYRKYALFLYKDFSNTYQSEADAQLKNILNPDYKFKSHGVHTFEHARALIIAKYASNNEQLNEALNIYLERIKNVTTISGGAIGDEWIAGRNANETHTGYEYCSLQELLHSYCLLVQKTGIAIIGDDIENIFYNAAQGSRNPNHSCIAYLKTDNSFEMLGTKNGEIEPDRKQTRYKYSPAHQDVAVCCNPNAGRISPYFIQNSWMKENDTTLVATLLMPNILETLFNGSNIQIENITEYPYQNKFQFRIRQSKPSKFTLKIRKPIWVTKIKTKEKFKIENGFIVIERDFSQYDLVNISFESQIEAKTDNTGSYYFTYGALLFALPLQAKEIVGKEYVSPFFDYMYQPISTTKYSYKKGTKIKYENGKLKTKLVNQNTENLEKIELIPFGKTILRQVSFK